MSLMRMVISGVSWFGAASLLFCVNGCRVMLLLRKLVIFIEGDSWPAGGAYS